MANNCEVIAGGKPIVEHLERIEKETIWFLALFSAEIRRANPRNRSIGNWEYDPLAITGVIFSGLRQISRRFRNIQLPGSFPYPVRYSTPWNCSRAARWRIARRRIHRV